MTGSGEGLHSEETGKQFNELIENPVSRLRHEIVQSGEFVPPNRSWNEYRAIVGLMRLQVQRDPDALSSGKTKFSLDDLVRQGEQLLNLLGVSAHETYKLIGVTLPTGAGPMFFPENVYFPIPLIGAPPILAFPLTPWCFVALPRKDFPRDQLAAYLRPDANLSVLSVGLGRTTNRVLIPPELLDVRDGDPEAFKRALTDVRTACREIFNDIGEMNRLCGFQAFTSEG